MICIEWTTEREAELKKLHEEGLSASQIAFQMGGITRNSVIGKRTRMGLVAVNKPHVHNAPRAPRKPREAKGHHQLIFKIVDGGSGPPRISRAKATDMPALRCVEVEPLHISFADLEPGMCKYPFGDGPFTFCGHPGIPYCEPHRALAYEPLKAIPRAAWKREGTDFSRRSA